MNAPAPGTPVHVAMEKWGARPHWQFDGVLLGVDAQGAWVGTPQGTRHHRPGMEFRSAVHTVTLVPREGWFLATFQNPGIWCDTYVDMTTPATWDGVTLRAVDLDLDVIRMSDPRPADLPPAFEGRGPGQVWVDDEDEFAEHQVAYGYPAEVIAAAQASCDAVFDALSRERAPFDGSHLPWLAQVR